MLERFACREFRLPSRGAREDLEHGIGVRHAQVWCHRSGRLAAAFLLQNIVGEIK